MLGTIIYILERDMYKGEIEIEMDKEYCEFCFGGKALVIDKTNDVGIAIQYPNRLVAYRYDIHGSGSNGIATKIKYCPMCGRRLINKRK